MKKILFNSLLLITLSASAYTQSLKNTSWNVYDSLNVLTYKFYFGTDTGFISSNLSTYYPLTIFSENGNQVTFQDIKGAPLACPPEDKGRYTFAIQNNKLIFTVISEPCPGRTSVLTLYQWVKNTTGIEDQYPDQDIQVFPNPSTDGIFHLKIYGSKFDKISLHTAQGNLISEESIFGQAIVERPVYLSDFASGIYFLTLHGKQGNKVLKLVR